MGDAMRTVSLKLPAALDRALSELARRRHSSRSALIREAVAELTRRDGGSVAELAEDLAGSLTGPEDLSCGSGHMDGYGE